MGGASSIDKEYRTVGLSWWAEELPSVREMEEGFANLEKVEYAVDYIITHSAPSIALPSINLTYKPDVLTKYLTVIQQITEYTHWYCGHYHINKSYHIIVRQFIMRGVVYQRKIDIFFFI